MRISVDVELCNGHGECVVEAPEVFDLADDADTVVLLDAEPGAELQAVVERAVALCPVRALRIEA